MKPQIRYNEAAMCNLRHRKPNLHLGNACDNNDNKTKQLLPPLFLKVEQKFYPKYILLGNLFLTLQMVNLVLFNGT